MAMAPIGSAHPPDVGPDTVEDTQTEDTTAPDLAGDTAVADTDDPDILIADVEPDTPDAPEPLDDAGDSPNPDQADADDAPGGKSRISATSEGCAVGRAGAFWRLALRR